MIELKNVNFEYENSTKGIKNFNLNIKRGEAVCLTGTSGSGKTTITRLILGLIPYIFKGNLSGDISIDGKQLKDNTIYEWSQHIGSVFQDPRSQFFCLNTTSELVFELENYAVSREVMLDRIEEESNNFNFKKLLNRNIFNLSGGEKQLIACLATSICKHPIIVLDEPSSNLDFSTIKKLKQLIENWKQEGRTIIIAEHRLHYLLEVVDKFILMEEGSIEKIYSQKEFKELSNNELKKYGLRATKIDELKIEETPSNSEGYHYLNNFLFHYDKNQPNVININDLKLSKGEITALIGKNGAGKSTFSRCLTGLERKFKGTLTSKNKRINNKALSKYVYMVFQDVESQLFTESLEEELKLSNPHLNQEEIQSALSLFDLDREIDRHPLSLSGGEKQRLAILSAIESNRHILIFDEPTSGLDGENMRKVAEELRKLADQGYTILVVTHDYEFILSSSDYVIQLENGEVKSEYPLNNRNLEKLKEFFTL